MTLNCWSCDEEFTLDDHADCDGCCWACGKEIDLAPYLSNALAKIEELEQKIADDELQAKADAACDEWARERDE